MGNDGGSIPKRIDLVKHKKEPVRKDYTGMNRLRAKHCAISNDPLKGTIVGCRMGYLYNKEALLEGLISKTIPK